jgi:hypothetical protein
MKSCPGRVVKRADRGSEADRAEVAGTSRGGARRLHLAGCICVVRLGVGLSSWRWIPDTGVIVTTGEAGQPNAHAVWRLAEAARAAGAYTGNGRVAALTAAGSVGSGLADRFSDLELDCYWHEPPSDQDRMAPIERLGGRVEAFYEYEATSRSGARTISWAGCTSR